MFSGFRYWFVSPKNRRILTKIIFSTNQKSWVSFYNKRYLRLK
jgi:hypothetical protein